MAIEFAYARLITRSKGHNLVHAAAYRARERLLDEKTGRTYDYSKREDLKYSTLILPQDASPKFQDRQTLMNALERAEDAHRRHATAQLAKEYILALPKELALDEQIRLAETFAKDHFVKHGLAVDLNIHDKGDGNPHAHILVSMRRIIGETIAPKKARDLNPVFFKNQVVEQQRWNKAWAQAQNAFFIEEDLPFRVDATSIIPTRHQGRIWGFNTDGKTQDMTDATLSAHETANNGLVDKDTFYLAEDNALVREAAIDIAVNDPSALLVHLTLSQVIFSERDIATLIMKHTDNRADYDKCLLAFKQLPELIVLGENEAGFPCYTTTTLYEKEDQLIQTATMMRETSQITIARQSVMNAIQSTQLNAEQADAVHDIITGGQLSCLVGRAGTGKSFTAKALNQIYKEAGYRVLGAATAGIAAHGLEEASHIKSKVLSSLCYSLRKGHLRLSKQDVILIDEAGMVELDMMSEVIQAANSAGAKIILIGDPDQLPAIGQGNPFKAIIEQVGFSELAQIQRQKKEGDCQASRLLAGANTGNALHNVTKALTYYDEQGSVIFGRDAQDTHARLLRDWLVAQETTLLADQLILAFRRDDVFALNEKARLRLIDNGTLGQEEWQLHSSHGVRPVRQGERLLCTRNKGSLGLVNGQFVTLVGLNNTHITLQHENGKNQSIALTDYTHFEYGYAVTVHKSQGMSIKNVFIAATGRGWDRFLTYVALTRHKVQLKLYANQQEHAGLRALARHLARGQVLDSILRYPLSFARRHGLSPDGVLARFIIQVGAKVEGIKDKWSWFASYSATLQRAAKKMERLAKQVDSLHARVVARYVTLNLELGHQRKSLYATLDSDPTLVKQWALLDTAAREKARHTAFYAHPRFKAIYRAEIMRNEKAAYLYDNIIDFEESLGINRVDIQRLARERERHRFYSHVERYQSTPSQTEKETLAFVMLHMAKDHHRYIEHEPGVDWKMIRADAKAHEVAMVLENASTAERNAISAVEKYSANYLQAQAAWKAYFDMSKPDPEEEFEGFEDTRDALLREAQSLTRKRDHSAHHLWENKDQDTVTLALTLFDIIETPNTPRFSPKELRKQRHIPQYRYTRLQQYATRYEARKTVSAYIALCDDLNDPALTNKRLALAGTIYRSRKFHNGPIHEHFRDMDEAHKRTLWQQLKQDAQRAKIVRAEQRAKGDEKIFLSAWHALVECSQQRQKGWQAYYNQANPGKPSSELDVIEKTRLTLLEKIANIPDYKRFAKRHNIALTPLIAAEDTLAAKTRVETFIDTNTSRHARTLLADTIYSDLRTHIRHLKSANIPVVQIKKLAEQYQRRTWLGTLNTAQRQDASVAAQFVRLSGQRRRAWQTFSRLKKSGAHKDALRKVSAHAKAVQYKLDSVSHTLQRDPSRYGHFVALYEIKLEKLRHYSASYTDFLKTLEQHVAQRNALMEKALPWHANIEKQIKEDDLEFSFWFDEWQGLMQAQTKLQQRAAQYPGLSDVKDLFIHDERFTAIMLANVQAALNVTQGASDRSLLNNGGPLSEGAISINKYWDNSTPIPGTLAERYLNEHRQIKQVYSDDIRFISESYNHILKQSYPCLILFMRDKNNQLVACQRTFLDPMTGNKIQNTDEEKRASKLSRNAFPEALKNAPLALSNPSRGQRHIVLAEGFETGASIAQVKPNWDVRVVFGVRNFKNLAPAIFDNQSLTIAMDNDARKHDKDIQDAIIQLQAKGYTVDVVEPINQKTDYNDVLQTKGEEGLTHELTIKRHFHVSPTVQMDIQVHTQKAAIQLVSQLTALQDKLRLIPAEQQSEVDLPKSVLKDESDFDKRLQAIDWRSIERDQDRWHEDLLNRKRLYDEAVKTREFDQNPNYYLKVKQKLIAAIVELKVTCDQYDNYGSLHPVVADTLKKEAEYHLSVKQSRTIKHQIKHTPKTTF